MTRIRIFTSAALIIMALKIMRLAKKIYPRMFGAFVQDLAEILKKPVDTAQ